MDKVDRLYEIYNILADSGDKAIGHESEYLEIIQAVKGNSNEKGLACQFIPKFLMHFPHLFQTALEAQLDLAEDDDVTIRKMAVKNLPGFCKVSKQFVPKIADILTQMLQSEDSAELAIVHVSLMTIMELDIQGTLQGILIQISSAEEDTTRKRAIEFLISKLKVLPEDLLTKEVEEFLLECCKKVLPKVNGQDFLNLLTMLSHLKIAKNIPVQNTVVNIIANQLDLKKEFDVSTASVTCLMTFLTQALRFFSPFTCSTKFAFYICTKVFPKLEDVKNLDNEHDLVLDIFKALAEMSTFARESDEIKECCNIVFKELLRYIPLPPATETENDSDVDKNLHFTHIECLLFTFVQFLKHDDEIITADSNAESFKDFKLRLQYLARQAMHALKQLKEPHKTAKDIDKKESKSNAIAEHNLKHVNALIKDFFRNPPSFKTPISFSWKLGAAYVSGVGIKRCHEASSSAHSLALAKREKRACREIYVPPSGKYSSRIGFSSSKDSKEENS